LFLRASIRPRAVVLRSRLAALVRAKVTRGTDPAAAERLRAAIKRLSDAYTWGGVGEAD
jgi:hypothetical protein